MEWGCIKCGEEIPQDREFCTGCEEIQFRKIGGLLYIPLVGLIISAISYLLNVNEAFKAIIENYRSIDINAKVFFISSLAIYVVMFLFAAFTLSQFLKRKRLLPNLYISFLIAIIITLSINTYTLYALIPGVKIGYDELVPIFRSLISALIWIPYFTVSVRVKRTFIK